MKARAYVLIETAVGTAQEVVRSLQKMKPVVSSEVVLGAYDIIAIVEADELGAIAPIVSQTIHTTKGVIRTVTCMSVTA